MLHCNLGMEQNESALNLPGICCFAFFYLCVCVCVYMKITAYTALVCNMITI